MDVQAEQLQNYAFNPGPGTRAFPSPRPEDVRDLILPPRKWVQVDPVYLRDQAFTRAQKSGSFQFVQAADAPDDQDLGIDEKYLEHLTDFQKAMVYQICAEDFSDQFKDVITVDRMVDDVGIPRRNTNVKVSYLKENHRPFLLALQDLEKRWRKRKDVLALIKKSIERIEGF